MDDRESYERLRRLDSPLGEESRDLRLGDDLVRFRGLDSVLAGSLERRWGGFLVACRETEPRITLQVHGAGDRGWLGPPEAGEQYRIESLGEGERRLVASYHFALAQERDGAWRLAVTLQDEEPSERLIENAARYIAARVALERGGFAMHAAAALHDGRVYIFAGPSGSGKTTAMRLARPARSLGDDFAMVVPGTDRWMAPALPFDNSERIPADALQGSHPVHGIWRLVQSEATQVETLPAGLAVASLMGCTAFPWAMPEMADRLLEHVDRFVAESRFGRLHFCLNDALWTHLV